MVLEDFLNKKLILEVNDVSDETIACLADLVGDIKWVDGESIDSHFIRTLKDKFIYVSDGIMFFHYSLLRSCFRSMKLTEFIKCCFGTPIKFKDVDVMTVFNEQ